METNASCIGHRRWAIAEGYIPAWSNGPSPEMQSHETCCVLNAGDEPAHVTLTLYFEDRDPVGPTGSPCRRDAPVTCAST
ncbi:TPA: sensory rhodopsin transducer, partial [Stenotrophomonas maltophilia]